MVIEGLGEEEWGIESADGQLLVTHRHTMEGEDPLTSIVQETTA